MVKQSSGIAAGNYYITGDGFGNEPDYSAQGSGNFGYDLNSQLEILPREYEIDYRIEYVTGDCSVTIDVNQKGSAESELCGYEYLDHFYGTEQYGYLFSGDSCEVQGCSEDWALTNCILRIDYDMWETQ